MKKLVLLAAIGSALMLAGAFAFQYLGEMPPCKLCIWQRWPHGIAAVLGLVIWLMPNRLVAFVGMLVVLFGAGVAFYHAGVEQMWWAGPDSCTGLPDLGGALSGDSLWARPIVRCDEIPWQMFGLSMAAWNGVISLGLAGMWALGWRKGFAK